MSAKHKEAGQQTYHCPKGHHQVDVSWNAGYPKHETPNCSSCGATMKEGPVEAKARRKK